MTSFPHSLVLDFWAHNIRNLNLYNLLINKLIFMEIVAKCSSCISFSCKVEVKVCYHISLEDTSMASLYEKGVTLKDGTVKMQRSASLNRHTTPLWCC